MMEKIRFFFSNLWKTSHTGTVLFFLFNTAILQLILRPALGNGFLGFLAMLFWYGLSLALSFSPAGQAVLCAVNGAKRMARADMREKVLPVMEEVYRAARRKTPQLPDRIRVRILYDPNPNAFAIGTRTICVTEGLLDLPENWMAGVLAHEMGHLALQHTVIQILIGGGNLIFSGMILTLECLRILLSVGAAAGSLRRHGALGWAGVFLAALSAGMIFVWTKLCLWLLMGSSRANEYAADAYTFEIGYGNDLAEALDCLTMGMPPSTFLKALSDSHPEAGDRIGRLQRMGATYSRY